MTDDDDDDDDDDDEDDDDDAAGEPAVDVVDPSAEHQVPRGHAALPLLPLLPRLPGAAHLPLQVPLPGGEGGLRGEDAGLRLPLASHAGL